MNTFEWEDGTVVERPYIEINGVKHYLQDGTMSGGTPVSSANLNEMQDIINQNIYDVYSSSETKIGTWIDDKPIYRVVLDEISGGGVQSISIADYDIDTMVNYDAMQIRDNGTIIDYEKPYFASSTDYFRCFYRKSSSTIEIRQAGTYTTYKTRIIIYYTKLSD